VILQLILAHLNHLNSWIVAVILCSLVSFHQKHRW